MTLNNGFLWLNGSKIGQQFILYFNLFDRSKLNLKFLSPKLQGGSFRVMSSEYLL